MTNPALPRWSRAQMAALKSELEASLTTCSAP